MKNLIYIILGIIIGAVTTYYVVQKNLTDDIKITKPKGVITPEQAKVLNDNWSRYRKAAVDSAAQKQGREIDNRSVWWSIEDIENYIAFSKKQTDSLKYNLTGMRVYLGVYGKNAGQAKKNLTTMFLVPTVKKLNSKGSMIPFVFQEDGANCEECDPLNAGHGGNGGGYP